MAELPEIFRAGDQYSPRAAHARTHLFADRALGGCREVVHATPRQNERGWMKPDKLYGDGHHGHNVHYLATAYSSKANTKKRKEAARELLRSKKIHGSRAAGRL